jgi:hypothetical protein
MKLFHKILWRRFGKAVRRGSEGGNGNKFMLWNLWAAAIDPGIADDSGYKLEWLKRHEIPVKDH